MEKILILLPSAIIAIIWLSAVIRCDRRATRMSKDLERAKIKERAELIVQRDRAKENK